MTNALVRLGRLIPRDPMAERAFLPAALEIVETPPSPTVRVTALAICAVFTIGIIWAWVGKVDVVAVAPGKIVASGRTKIVQPAEIGTVRAIHVDEGQRVKAGDVLIELDPTTSTAEREHAARDLEHAQLDIARLNSLLGDAAADPFAALANTDPADIAAARRQAAAQRVEQEAKLGAIDRTLAAKKAEVAEARATIAQIDAALPIAAERADIRRDGVESGFGSRLAYLEAENQATQLQTSRPIEQHKLEEAQAAVEAAKRSHEQTEAEYTRTLASDLTRAQEQANAAAEALAKATERNRLQRLVAPVDGTVEGLAVHTLGAVVTPAQQLLAVVPTEGGIDIEAMIDNRDIGFVSAGQKAEIKVETFPYTRYGLLHGMVRDVSMDAVALEERDDRPMNGTRKAADEPSAIQRAQHLVYAARVTMDRTSMAIDGRNVELIPGMAVTVEIKTGRRRVLDYLLSPLGDAMHDSLRER
jgi:hemolysin D